MLSLTSKGYNFDRGTSCGLNSAGDQYNVDPLLGPLSANGGSTLTHALLSGSPAIDATPVYRAPTTDQRGIMNFTVRLSCPALPLRGTQRLSRHWRIRVYPRPEHYNSAN